MPHQPFVEIAITTGEPAGIGPEVSLKAALEFLKENSLVRITLIGNSSLFSRHALSTVLSSDRLRLLDLPLSSPVKEGILNVANARYVLNILDVAIEGCLNGHFDAMVTAPLQKSIINEIGIPFTGHTEYLAKKCGENRVVMLLCANLPSGILQNRTKLNLRVALVTTHIPLKAVAENIDYETVLDVIKIVDGGLRNHFAISTPSIRVSGLNPHAGESGYLGNEEVEIIVPAIVSARNLGISVTGPYPGDTMFDINMLNKVDAFISMYHDQGLAPFKFVAFGGGVNVTLGLPIIRTSVDHGTALEIAGKNQANAGSMLEALRLAYQMAKNRNNAPRS